MKKLLAVGMGLLSLISFNQNSCAAEYFPEKDLCYRGALVPEDDFCLSDFESEEGDSGKKLTYEEFIDKAWKEATTISSDYKENGEGIKETKETKETNSILDEIIDGGADKDGKISIVMRAPLHGYPNFPEFVNAILKLDGLKKLEFVDGYKGNPSALRRMDWPCKYIKARVAAALIASRKSITVIDVDVVLKDGSTADPDIYPGLSDDEITAYTLRYLNAQRRRYLNAQRRKIFVLWQAALLKG